MRAALIRGHGRADVLQLDDVPEPMPAPGEALVRVRACALNHLDLWRRTGIPGRTFTFPHILGNDIAGEVESLNGPANGLASGQRVMLSPGTSCGRCHECLSGEDSSCRQYQILGYQRNGGYAEHVTCPLANLIPLPDGFSFEEAAAFPLVFLTAWRMLVTRARLRAGEDVLVWAAGSGVGMAAIQVAKLFGARVIATAGTEAKLAQAAALGADTVVNHRSGDVASEVKRFTEKKGVEVVIEHVGQDTWERSILCLAPRGRLVTCGATTGPDARTDLRYVFSKQLSLLGSYMGSKAELLDAAAWFWKRRLRTVVHAVLPLAEARRAHEMLEASEHFGKIVLRV
jgi:NADPH:quinone reductase-like Zn-dependent oxidoreductase